MSRGASDLMEALRSGHCYVALSPHAPSVDIRYAAGSMGDTVCFDGKTALCARACGLERGDVLRLVSAVRTQELVSEGECEMELRVIPRGEDLFWRAEIWRTQRVPASLPDVVTNPVYHMQP